MVHKCIWIIGAALVMLVLAAGCGADTAADDTAQDTSVEMTLEELSEYDGQDGSPAYIAVDGVIYDVSDVSFWSGGLHNGFSAGNDLTEQIKTISPHGVSKLKGLPVVGTLAE